MPNDRPTERKRDPTPPPPPLRRPPATPAADALSATPPNTIDPLAQWEGEGGPPAPDPKAAKPGTPSGAAPKGGATGSPAVAPPPVVPSAPGAGRDRLARPKPVNPTEAIRDEAGDN